jgi:hypothetical protein
MCRVLRIAGFVALAMGLSIPGLGAADVTVPCPGEIVDSSPAITNALLSLRPGGTVRLQECTYYLSGPVVITGSFDGALRGAGMGKTVLTTRPDADGIEDVLMRNWISDLDTPGSPGPTHAATLFHFSLFGSKPSRLAMSDLTIEITDLHPAPESARAEWFADALLAIITVEGVRVSTDFDLLELRGVTGDFGLGGNALYGIEMWGEMSFWPSFGTLKPMTGDHTVRRSVFDGLPSGGYDAEGMVNSRVMIRENRAANSTWQSFIVAAMKASTVHVSHNVIELSGDYALGMWLELLDGALVNQNRISGAGAIGIVAGSGSRYRILNNDVSDLTVPGDSYAIVLGADTSDSLVVGADPSTVLDLGTNNRILPGRFRH